MANSILSQQEAADLMAALAARRRATSVPWFYWASMGLIAAITVLLAAFMVVDLIRDLAS